MITRDTITSKQRSKLKGIASTIAPIAQIGKGGVTEAVLRNFVLGHDREEINIIKKIGVRGDKGLKEFSFDHAGRTIRAAVVSGLRNADELLRAIKAGEKQYDFVEVMACPGGCVMGGGQPVHIGRNVFPERSSGLYETDINMQIKKPNEFPLLEAMYATILKGREHELLHRNMEGK